MAEQAAGKSVTIEPTGFSPLDAGGAPPPRRLRRGRLLLLLSLAGFIAIMAFLFAARSLEVEVVATTDAEVSVSGLAVPFGGRYLLLPGEHEIGASAAGYAPMTTTVTVDDSEGQRVELVLTALPGLLSLTSEPPGARVSLDGEALGVTPLTDVPVAAGSHRLLLEAPRYLPLEQDLEVTGRDVRQQLSLALAPAWADVSVASTPAGASILLDGEPVGTTPAQLEVLQGERQLLLQLERFADWEQQLNVTAGQVLDLGDIALQPAAGVLQLDSRPAGANVTLDGEFQGQTPLRLSLAPGREHQLAVFKPGYRRHAETVQLPAAGRAEQTVELKARFGEVHFRITPADATVRIDGQSRGGGEFTLSLPAVAHRVEVSRDGYATVRRQVTPRPGLPQRVEVTLLTESAARVARVQSEITTSLGQTLLLFNPGASAQADFTMGASRREPGRRANEVLHPVSLRRMFYLQTTEVTNAQFRQFTAGHDAGQVEGNSLNRDHQPAVQVSWQQAAAFCNWLSRREGLPPFYREQQGIITGFDPDATGYRLPSEAEWAWAARTRGGDLLTFPWGEDFPPTAAVENYADTSSAYVTGRVLNGYNDGHVVSAPVASFAPNQHGLYDMGGNVAEWVHDVYGIPQDNGAIDTDPLGADSGDNYVIRGAGWTHARRTELRLSYRDYGQAGRDDVGFRIARYAE